nr:unnamed protein product [Digitaria exilis]
MDRVQLVLLGLPILLFCSDVVTLFAPLPPAAPKPGHQSRPATDAFQPGDPSAADASAQAEPQVDGPGSGTTVDLKFCASCSYSELELKELIGSRIPDPQVEELIVSRMPDPQVEELIVSTIPDPQVEENPEEDLIVDDDGNDDNEDDTEL